MFENLTERLGQTLKNISGQGRLSDNNIKDALRELRMALLEADVALPVVKDFIEQVRAKAVGQDVIGSLTPGQALIKVVRDELTALMGEQNESLNLRAAPPVVVLMAGLQGSGKTTSVAKLARLLKERENKKVMVVSCDVYRPAAIEQLKTLADEVEANFFPSDVKQKPEKIAANALKQARKQGMDVLLIDTAGRLHIDAEMMSEIKALHQSVEPTETLFVVDSMTGQDAANTAKAFNDALPLTGVILTKTDGDARGGAALSVRQITGKPIKFMGVGEKTTALEPFHPERIASRIIGQGDVLSLIEEVERKVDKDKAQKLAKKMVKGKGFTLEDFAAQLEQMRNMGNLDDLMNKIPGMNQVPQAVKNQVDGRQLVRMEAMISSMTPHERRFPAVIKGSRKRRIAGGSGTQVQDVNKMLKQFMQMQKMMKQMKKKGNMARMMQGLKGKMPPGMSF
ncbi:signal recognition particle protein [Candidatus Venteria ishoeyi]|uniref:Signal recognition particle protein n=1 Tax=Candidatus Venteria ishoeyi TaxID=1899563 RepID=A0A1H6FEY4_9GAMM|nr:signal recognition particle protein [Candidatus Venteria ishoeyi]MDM8545508.1 signal recognition particle protein [Candidatus Venteria ishoeyi]SEH07595.1 Signal recognition particle protein [Candidatus Venteria ishoeyi]